MTEIATAPRAFIVHGFGATPQDHWFGWLARQLEAAGVSASVPALPDSHSPEPDRWADALCGTIGVPDQNTIVVAHSLGCITALRHLAAQRPPWRLGTLVLVAGFLDRLPALPELDGFIGDGCDVTGIADHVDRVIVLRSDEDLVVPIGHTDRLAALLGTSARVVPGAGHFVGEDGVTTLPQALQAILDGAPLPSADSSGDRARAS